MHNRRSARHRRPAATMVEAALVLSGLILLLLGLTEYGRFVMIKHLVDNAAREGARLAVAANTTNTNSFDYQTTTTVQNRVLTALAGQQAALSGLTVQVYAADANGNSLGSWTSATAGQNIAVQIDATYVPMLPGLSMPFGNNSVGLLPGSGIGIHAKTMMQTENNS